MALPKVGDNGPQKAHAPVAPPPPDTFSRLGGIVMAMAGTERLFLIVEMTTLHIRPDRVCRQRLRSSTKRSWYSHRKVTCLQPWPENLLTTTLSSSYVYGSSLLDYIRTTIGLFLLSCLYVQKWPIFTRHRNAQRRAVSICLPARSRIASKLLK